MESNQDKFAKLSEAGNEVKNRVRGAVGSAGEYVDTASTTLGRGMETAAEAVAHRVDSAAGGVASAGRYLQRSNTEDLGHDLTDWVRNHPGVSLGVGFGIGLLIGRAISR